MSHHYSGPDFRLPQGDLRLQPIAVSCVPAAGLSRPLMIERSISTEGPIDVLVLNAGYGREGILEESPLAELIQAPRHPNLRNAEAE
jgi:hypothetical protein